MLDSKANKESVVDVAYVDVGLYFDIIRFLEKHKDKISGDELTILHIVSGAYLLKEDVKSRAILTALDIMARYEGAHQAVRASVFDPNDRPAIEAALANPDPDNPITLAVTARLKDLMGRYWHHSAMVGGVPTELVLPQPRTALDDVACRLFLQTVADTLGHKLTILWIEEEAREATPTLE